MSTSLKKKQDEVTDCQALQVQYEEVRDISNMSASETKRQLINMTTTAGMCQDKLNTCNNDLDIALAAQQGGGDGGGEGGDGGDGDGTQYTSLDYIILGILFFLLFAGAAYLMDILK